MTVDIESVIRALSPDERAKAVEAARALVTAKGFGKWQPNPGPQTDAYFSQADELLYGGEPGGGKSDLCLGLAFTQHQRTLFIRRQYTDLGFATERAIKLNGTRNGFSGQSPPQLNTADGRVIDFGACKLLGDEQHWMGNPHDLIAIDEATQLAESQVRFLMGWLRSEKEGQRTRVVMATNPALRPEGLWVNVMFAPWLDPKYPDPAKPGELRWYYTDSDGADRWVDGPGEYGPVNVAGQMKMVRAKSRTFISASVKDNPYYVRSGYQAQLDAMPEPFRSLLLGGFKTSFTDAPNQVIPTAWVRAAMDRWTSQPPRNIPMCAIGVDASGGGADPMTVALRHDGWYAPIVEVKGKDIPVERAGHYCAGVIVSHRVGDAPVIIDMGGGYGMSTYERLRENGVPVEAFKGSERSTRRTRDGIKGFANRRAEIYWKFREALDPSRQGGTPISLPDDQMLLADLTAVVLHPNYLDDPLIWLEPKKDLAARLGRSPDRGDAVVMAWALGMRDITGEYAAGRRDQRIDYARGRLPQVIARRPR